MLLNYEVSGRGDPPLLLVHGWCSNLRHWDAQTNHFADRHRVVAVDRRGHGGSDVPTSGYTTAQGAADLAEVLSAEDLVGAIAVGHAGGCPALLGLAGSNPDLISALVLIDTHIGTGGGRGLAAMIERLDGPSGRAAFTEIYRGFFSQPDGPIAAAAIRDAQTLPHRVVVADLAALAVDSVALARLVEQPVLWLTPDPADQAWLSGIFPDVQFAQVEGSGHFPHLEVPDQVNALIEDFIAAL